MRITSTPVLGVKRVEEDLHVDARGVFARVFCKRELASLFSEKEIVQINHSKTIALGAVRGLHFQFPPHCEAKLVCCLKGRVWDVAVDLRKGSPTFLCWHAEELSPERRCSLFIPEGCAHGFQVLESESELFYLSTAFYAAKAEGGLRFDDPRLAIKWPLAVVGLSERDRQHSLLSEDFAGISP